MIRITGGKYRSRKLFTPETTLTKPTMDKVRAAVFNALGNDLSKKSVLDLFSGSGSYGFESLSRNAGFVDFVDQTRFSKEAVEKNGKMLNDTLYEFHLMNAISFLNETNKTFDYIFMDPPYKLNIITDALDLIQKRALLNQNGVIVVESEREIIFNETYCEIKHYKYGLAHIYILRK